MITIILHISFKEHLRIAPRERTPLRSPELLTMLERLLANRRNVMFRVQWRVAEQRTDLQNLIVPLIRRQLRPMTLMKRNNFQSKLAEHARLQTQPTANLLATIRSERLQDVTFDSPTSFARFGIRTNPVTREPINLLKNATINNLIRFN